MDNNPTKTQTPGTPEDGAPGGLEQQLQDARDQAEQHWNAYLRAVADLDNYRKRAAREAENARQFGVERLAASLLPALDGLELGAGAADQADAATLAEGQRATLKLLLKALEAAAVDEIDPAGEPFDPERHEAIRTQATAEAAPGTVLTVIQKGYVLNGRLLRPARVVVAAAPQP
jgi:molecular chaperone GrpE